jgi:hypothetical protein
MDTLPLPPSPHPFDGNARVLSFFALSKKKTTTDVSRKLSARFSILLSERFLVGGICFGGFPYLYYSRQEMEKSGENSANFGLPREVRLTCLGGTGGEKDSSPGFEYLDAEISATKQEIISDSGFHFLCIDPTLTNVVTVHFSDYPTILRKTKVNTRTRKFTEDEHYGFIIPYFYVFEYKEKSRYRPQISAGLLGAKSNHRPTVDSPSKFTIKNVFTGLVDYKHIVSGPGASLGGNSVVNANYFDFTAASVFGQQRNFTVRSELYDGKKAKGKVRTRFEECFISQKIKPGKTVVFYIEQGEEYERCVAGLKMYLPFIPETALSEDIEKIASMVQEFLPGVTDIAAQIGDISREELEKYLRESLEIPPKIDFCERVGVRVFEIDPLEGVSPISVPLEGKYATLLAETDIDKLSEISLALFLEGIKFVRPSNAKFFAVELTNADTKAGQFVIKRLRLVQSAHVSIHPRAAKTQQVRTLNFRIFGADLAEDYSFLGKEGFNFSIERFVAGARKSVLFRANSLLDLLHSGAAKIFSNVRRRAVESYQSKNSGWRRTEAGDGVTGINYWTGGQLKKLEKNQIKFEVFNAQEIRTHSQILVPKIAENGFWKAMADYFNVIQAVHTLGGDVDPISPNGDLNGGWKNPDWNSFLSFPEIVGLQSLGVNPFSPVVTVVEALEKLVGQGEITLESAFESVKDLLGIYLFGSTALLITGGGATSVSVSPAGLGVSLGVNPIPSINNHTTHGSTGTIMKQASEAYHSYSQYLNTGYDEGVVAHAEVPGTDQQRVKGAEVMWQGELVDIITGTIPLNFTLPATAGKMHFRTSDDSLRVRFGSGVGKSISVDFWFDLTEEIIRDDN